MTRTIRGVLGALVVLAFALFPAAPAAAHTELKSTDPAAGSTVTAALSQVTLTFTQAVRQSRTTVTVTGADGVVYSEGTARSVDANVIQGVKPLPTGRVSVVWSTAAADGHQLTGQFAFTNAAAPPSPSPSPTSAAPTAAAPTGSAVATVPRSDDESGPGVGAIVAVAAGVGIALLAALFLWRRSRS